MVNYMYPFEQMALALVTHGIHGQLPRNYVETEALLSPFTNCCKLRMDHT
jgi:hypothetical protein